MRKAHLLHGNLSKVKKIWLCIPAKLASLIVLLFLRITDTKKQTESRDSRTLPRKATASIGLRITWRMTLRDSEGGKLRLLFMFVCMFTACLCLFYVILFGCFPERGAVVLFPWSDLAKYQVCTVPPSSRDKFFIRRTTNSTSACPISMTTREV